MTTEIARSAAGTAGFRSWAASHGGAAARPAALVNRPDLGVWALAEASDAGDAAAAALGALPTMLDAATLLAAVRGEGAVLGALLARDGHCACLLAGAAHGYVRRAGALRPLLPGLSNGASGPLRAGDRLLLCNAAVLGALGEAAAAAILGADEDAPAERLVLAALAAGAQAMLAAVAVEVVAVTEPFSIPPPPC